MPAAEEGAEKKERKEDEEPPEEGMVQSRSSSRKSNASIDDSKPIGDESRSAPTAVSNGDDVDQRNDLGIEGISDDDLEMSDGNDDGAMPGGEKSKAKLEKNVLKHASKKIYAVNSESSGDCRQSLGRFKPIRSIYRIHLWASPFPRSSPRVDRERNIRTLGRRRSREWRGLETNAIYRSNRLDTTNSLASFSN